MNGHNRLIRRNHTYYLRARIPLNLVYLTHRVQFCYSLQTNNYYEALAKLSKESHKIDVKINILKALDMLIKNKQLVILPEDIDKMVIHKLRQAEEVFENYDREIAEEKYDYQNLLMYHLAQKIFQERFGGIYHYLVLRNTHHILMLQFE